MPFGNSLVATAEGTQALTKGKMYVQADPLVRIALHKRLIDRVFPIVRVDRILFPVGNRRVASITRPGYILFLNQIIVHAVIQGSGLARRPVYLPNKPGILTETPGQHSTSPATAR